MGEVVRFEPPVIAVVAQPDGSMIEIRAGDRISVDDRGWTRVQRRQRRRPDTRAAPADD